MQTIEMQTKSYRRPPGLPKYVIESVDQQDESVLFTLRREVLWSVAHVA